MDFQLTTGYLAANWLPLLISLLIGFFLGWLFTGRPASKRANEAEAELANLKSQARTVQRQLEEALQEVEMKTAAITKGEHELEEAKDRNATLVEELTAAHADLNDIQSGLRDRDEKMELLEASLVSKTSELEALNLRLAHAGEELESARSRMAADAEAKAQEIEAVTSELEASRGENAGLNTQIEAANANISAITAELTETKTAYDRLAAELETVKSANTGLSTELELMRSTRDSLEKELQDSAARNDQEEERLAELNGQIASLQADLDAAQEEVQRKNTALSEAYARAVALEQGAQNREALVESAQAQLGDARALLEAANAENKALQSRLAEVRGEVAGEMALMTSTMMREKDAVIAEANARIAALTEEIRILKAGDAAQA